MIPIAISEWHRARRPQLENARLVIVILLSKIGNFHGNREARSRALVAAVSFAARKKRALRDHKNIWYRFPL